METITQNKIVAKALEESTAYRKEVLRMLKLDDNEYNLKEWVTPKKYCEIFKIKDIQILQNWISRGVVPSENIKIIEELNGLKLIKAIPYK